MVSKLVIVDIFIEYDSTSPFYTMSCYSRYQENPTYGKASDIEVQMSTLRNELRLLEMSRCGLSSQVYKLYKNLKTVKPSL